MGPTNFTERSSGHSLGKTISHYRLEEELGRGGMGVVYRAHDEQLGRDVALKLLHGDLNDTDRRNRILAEARAAAALNHPGIVTIYEVGEDGPQLFISMELISGDTLRQIACRGLLSPQQLARLCAQIADALGAAHAHGVVHGDVKPENIVRQADGRVKLLDFGIARHAELDSVATTGLMMPAERLAAPTEIAGTVAYMAPEQLAGATIDHRTDIFALGVVCYELAFGRRPFLGATITTLVHQILNETAVIPADRSEVPSDLTHILTRLLAKDPDARYQSARDVALDLTNVARSLELGPRIPAAVAGKRTVAVLPFTLLTPSTEDEYLSVALADAVINHLTASDQVLVRPTSMVRGYAGNSIEPIRTGRELNVEVIVHGSLQKMGSKVRVHLQATRASDGSTLLSAKQDGEMADLFGLQDALAEIVASALELKQRDRAVPAEERSTNNKVAYELSLRAVDKLSRLNRWDTRAGIDMLNTAVKLDRRFAAAWARLAEAHLLMAFTFGEGARAIREAEHAARRALALDSSNSVAQCSHGLVLWSPARGFQNRAALRALAIALKLNPGNLTALLWQCLIFLHVGLFDAAKEGLRTALAVRPDDATTLFFLGQLAWYRHCYDEADEYQRRALAVDATHIWTNVFYPVIALYRGALEDAEQKLASAREIQPEDPWLTSCEALLWAKRGEKHKATQALSHALRGKKPLFHTHHMWHTAAAANTRLGLETRAVSLLERAAAFGMPNYTLFRDDPHFQPLHSQARFTKLLAKLQREHRGYLKDFDSAPG